MNKYNYSSTDNKYKTPKVLYQKALNHFGLPYGFSLDTCCSEQNIPALVYYKESINDGLKEDWMKYNWCNPPFNQCEKWVKKAYNENLKGNFTAMLIPVRTESAYWHKFILNNPHVNIDWLKKGYRFLNENDEEMGIFKNALAIVYFE